MLNNASCNLRSLSSSAFSAAFSLSRALKSVNKSGCSCTGSGTCQVILNGTPAGKKFCGPFVFEVSKLLKSGGNHLEVIVTNTLANAYSPREVELQMQETWQRSVYEDRQRDYESESLESGMIGPVMLKF